MRPRAIASICCSPPLSVPANWLRRSLSTGNRVYICSMLVLDCGLVLDRIGAQFEILEHALLGKDLAAFGNLHNAFAGDFPCR